MPVRALRRVIGSVVIGSVAAWTARVDEGLQARAPLFAYDAAAASDVEKKSSEVM